jgi:hypothetical protein
MDMTAEDIRHRRILMAVFGLLAGIAAHVILEVLPDLLVEGRLRLALSSFGIVFFSATLAMAGPLTLGRAALGGAVAGVVVAALLPWASLRFDGVGPFLDTGDPIIATLVAVAVFLPFWIAAAGPARDWKDYAALFDAAWRIVLRYIVAGLFTLLVWLTVFLADSLLGVVGIGIIGDLIAIDGVAFAITGAVFALGLAVAQEYAGTLSPYIVLRLLRLLLPPLVAVTGLFLVALPFRGLSGLFGGLSSAGVLMSVAILGITLVAIAADRSDAEAAASATVRLSARLMAVLLPFLGGLAVLAVAIRVREYGWSPDRVVAMIAALATTAYGLAYAGAAAFGRDRWMDWLRRVNVPLALGLGVVALLLLTPAIDPQRIAAQSQVARFEAGAVDADALDLWSLREDWGRAGGAALARLGAPDHPRAADIAERLAALRTAGDRYSFEAALPPAAQAALAAEIRDRLAVHPAGATVPEGLLDIMPVDELRRWREACDRRTPAGNPGCIAVLADLLPAEAGAEVLLFTLVTDDYVNWTAVVPARVDGATGGDGYAPLAPLQVSGDYSALAQPDALDRLLSGDFTVAPMSLNGLTLGGTTVFLQP